MRAFIAVDLPDNIKEEIYNISKDLKAFGKIVEKDNIHITLAFLGDIKDSLIEDLYKRLLDNLSSFKSFSISIDGFSSFNSRVYFFNAHSEELNRIYASIESILIDMKLDRYLDKEFRAHITVLRAKKRLMLNESKLAELSSYKRSFLCSYVSIKESRLRSNGPLYTDIYKIYLKS
ncbi:MAG: RNA 2',3'-cyclic phosphodiesterase [Candidatus Micrarchaeota archaeon]|nr:MAG: RNA 2',3'-cyclic phosphodiesterase [Candidatus Micrarchaeota archaeon]